MPEPTKKDEKEESIEVLRERLNTMKRIIQDKQTKEGATDFWKPSSKQVGIIDGNFLSMAFAGALIVIVTVSIYAFYHLYHAILKKFPSKHTEL